MNAKREKIGIKMKTNWLIDPKVPGVVVDSAECNKKVATNFFVGHPVCDQIWYVFAWKKKLKGRRKNKKKEATCNPFRVKMKLLSKAMKRSLWREAKSIPSRLAKLLLEISRDWSFNNCWIPGNANKMNIYDIVEPNRLWQKFKILSIFKFHCNSV